MGAYYYLMSSLPYLTLEQTPSIDMASFKIACETSLTASDMSVLVSAEQEMPVNVTGSQALKVFLDSEFGLRNALVRLRAAKSGFDPQISLRLAEGYRDGSDSSQVSEIARLALSAENPLEAENIIDRFRWRLLEDLDVGHHFDIENVMVYYLKLKILERRRSLVVPEGKLRYAASYDEVARSFPLDVES